MVSSQRPGKEVETLEATEAFTPVVTWPIVSEPQLTRDSICWRRGQASLWTYAEDLCRSATGTRSKVPGAKIPGGWEDQDCRRDYASDNALVDVKEQLEKAEAMIKKARFLISKAGPVHAEEIAWLEQLIA